MATIRKGGAFSSTSAPLATILRMIVISKMALMGWGAAHTLPSLLGQPAMMATPATTARRATAQASAPAGALKTVTMAITARATAATL